MKRPFCVPKSAKNHPDKTVILSCMIYDFSVWKTKRWDGNYRWDGDFAEMSVTGTVLFHPLTCYFLCVTEDEWMRLVTAVKSGDPVKANLCLSRYGDVQRTNVREPLFKQTQTDSVYYNMVGEVLAVDEETVVIDAIFPISFALDSVPGVAISEIKVGDWIQAKGRLEIDLDLEDAKAPRPEWLHRNLPDFDTTPTPFAELSPRDMALPQPKVPFNWASYQELHKKESVLLTTRSHFSVSRDPNPVPFTLNHQIHEEIPTLYRSKLPIYHLADCPICGGKVREAIDTFSVTGIGWRNDESTGHGWFGRHWMDVDGEGKRPLPSYKSDCSCVQGVTYGINFSGKLPDDVTGFVLTGSERPGLFAPFMEHSGGCAVIRTLPIGGNWRGTTISKQSSNFLPAWEAKYKAWFITYFNADPAVYTQCFGDNLPDSPNFYWPYDQMDYDLQPWVERGKLLIHPDSDVADVLSLQGLAGRWSVKARKFHLLPVPLPLKKAIKPSYKYSVPTKELEEEMLQERAMLDDQ